MRLEELVLRIPGDEFRVRFHEHLTVLSGIGLLEREALADSIARALAGTADGTELRYTDSTGRPVRVLGAESGAIQTHLDDATPAEPVVGAVCTDEAELRRRLLLRAGDLGLDAADPDDDEDPELTEARAALVRLGHELQAALVGQADRTNVAVELAEVEERLRGARDLVARHEHERLEARLAELQATLAGEAATDEAPANANADRDLLVRLATADQAQLWGAADQVAAAERSVERARASVSGAGPTVLADEATSEHLEARQRVVEALEARLERQWTPSIAIGSIITVCSAMLATIDLVLGPALLGVALTVLAVGIGKPWLDLRSAKSRRQDVLDELGAPTYLGFHLRRMEHATDQDALNRIEAHAADLRHAVEMWERLAPGVDVATARRLEPQARAIAAALAEGVHLDELFAGTEDVKADPHAQLRAEMAELRAELERTHRPEWDGTPAPEGPEPDVAALQARRDELAARLGSGSAADGDLERLAARHSAMEQHVAALEAGASSLSDEASISQLADLQQYLLAHLTQGANLGPGKETLPVVLDEPFMRIAAGRKWELLDMLRRLGEKTQLVYLTDDPYVTAWARRRAGAGLVTLLEPVDA